MGVGSLRNMILAMMVLLKGAFMIDREEYLSPDVEYEGDTVQLSFVFIKTDGPWHFGDEEGVHLLIKRPSVEQIHNIHDNISEKNVLMAHKKGLYRFCFTNKSPHCEYFGRMISRFRIPSMK
ncbi:transmembrane emp24 domain-containing protein p24beta2-like [Olea europaea var. sylvestris]|uniref:transmembrane emp24 domain-containing protein p24beta2-like n=1 Tax=Olea europaea var. sylvestris TaxID=158386 RepID=UPI000C1D80D0|nr:transmembrane emp24 domain-containing protein p24beta2-like [Olea europaea var. sylvestris]